MKRILYIFIVTLLCSSTLSAVNTANVNINGIWFTAYNNKWNISYTESTLPSAAFDRLIIDNVLYTEVGTMVGPKRGFRISNTYNRNECHIAHLDTYDANHNLLTQGADYEFGNVAACTDTVTVTPANIVGVYYSKYKKKSLITYIPSTSKEARFEKVYINGVLDATVNAMPIAKRAFYLHNQYDYTLCNKVRLDTVDATENVLSSSEIYTFGNLDACNDTLTISNNNTDDYICSGVEQDQVFINEALKRVANSSTLTTVYLKGPMTCMIDEPIVIPSNTKLLGDATVTVALNKNKGWAPNKPLIRQEGIEHWTDGNGVYGTANDIVSNLEIGGFKLTTGLQQEPAGETYYILMMFYSAKNLRVHHMVLDSSYGDAIRVMSNAFDVNNEKHSYNLEFDNNTIYGAGHDGLNIGMTIGLKVHDNKIYNTRTNAGIHAGSSNKIAIYDNTIENDGTASGNAGIYLENKFSHYKLNDANISGNTISGKIGGVLLESFTSDKSIMQGVHIYKNSFENIVDFQNTLISAIYIFGANNTLVEENTIKDSAKDGIVFEKGDIYGTGYNTTVKNNTISNCKGYGINNLSATDHTFINISNTFLNNTLGNTASSN